MHKTFSFIVTLLLVAAFSSCSKTPHGVINEDEMAHLLADFAKAEELMTQNPNLFPDDSSKLILKQSILKKYDADLEKYEASLEWYAHNLKIYAKVHEEAIKILEKESKDNGSNINMNAGNITTSNKAYPGTKSKYPTSGDNVWKDPQKWVLTYAMRDGYITFDYKPERNSRKGDKYSLGFKMMNSGNSITLMLALDYQDGSTSIINRTAHVNGWSENAIQSDSSKVIKRIYGFIRYKTRPHGITFIDSTYLLRTPLDQNKYSTISQRTVGPKPAVKKNDVVNEDTNETANEVAPTGASFPGRHNNANTPSKVPQQGKFKPKPGLNKAVIPSRERINNPNGAHVPRPPIR